MAGRGWKPHGSGLGFKVRKWNEAVGMGSEEGSQGGLAVPLQEGGVRTGLVAAERAGTHCCVQVKR